MFVFVNVQNLHTAFLREHTHTERQCAIYPSRCGMTPVWRRSLTPDCGSAPGADHSGAGAAEALAPPSLTPLRLTQRSPPLRRRRTNAMDLLQL